ncbi:MAG: alanine racemase, partial [Candidatus Latescibacteria bacterium]|nr:alanine racemase [Candidatus Latescibacterota bacterium]
ATQSNRPAYLEIDLSAISANIASVQNFVGPQTEILSVVKANAYGHGIKPVAKAALKGGASALGVALIQEGVILRKAGIRAPIIVLGPALPEQAETIVIHELSQTISNREILIALETAAKSHKTRASVHLKIDTGMGRVGISPAETMRFAHSIAKSSHLNFEGISTHIAWERAGDMDRARHQIDTFNTCLSELSDIPIRWRHTANSAMTVHLPNAHYDLVRVGLLTYGIPPTQGAGNIPLTPALSLKARITQICDLAPGQTLSYGGTFTLTRPSRIALVPIGYADGYNRRLSNRAHVLICGQTCPVVGTVCMDIILIDITHVPQVQLGEEVVLLGQQDDHTITVADLALWADDIPHEVVSQFHTRLPRHYTHLA